MLGVGVGVRVSDVPFLGLALGLVTSLSWGYGFGGRVGDVPFLGLGLGLVTSHFWVGFLGFAKTNTYYIIFIIIYLLLFLFLLFLFNSYH